MGPPTWKYALLGRGGHDAGSDGTNGSLGPWPPRSPGRWAPATRRLEGQRASPSTPRSVRTRSAARGWPAPGGPPQAPSPGRAHRPLPLKPRPLPRVGRADPDKGGPAVRVGRTELREITDSPGSPASSAMRGVVEAVHEGSDPTSPVWFTRGRTATVGICPKVGRGILGGSSAPWWLVRKDEADPQHEVRINWPGGLPSHPTIPGSRSPRLARRDCKNLRMGMAPGIKEADLLDGGPGPAHRCGNKPECRRGKVQTRGAHPLPSM